MTILAVILWCNLLQVKPQYLDTILEALKPQPYLREHVWQVLPSSTAVPLLALQQMV